MYQNLLDAGFSAMESSVFVYYKVDGS